MAIATLLSVNIVEVVGSENLSLEYSDLCQSTCLVM